MGRGAPAFLKLPNFPNDFRETLTERCSTFLGTVFRLHCRETNFDTLLPGVNSRSFYCRDGLAFSP